MLSPERMARIRHWMRDNPPPPLPAAVLDRIAVMLRPVTTKTAGHRPEPVTRRPSPLPSNPAAAKATRQGSRGDRIP